MGYGKPRVQPSHPKREANANLFGSTYMLRVYGPLYALSRRVVENVIVKHMDHLRLSGATEGEAAPGCAKPTAYGSPAKPTGYGWLATRGHAGGFVTCRSRRNTETRPHACSRAFAGHTPGHYACMHARTHMRAHKCMQPGAG